MFKRFVYWFADFVDNLWVTVFGKPYRIHDWREFQSIRRERYAKDPKYQCKKVYWGKKTLFSVKNNGSKKKTDVDCLLVNNRFVIIDKRDGRSRRYYAIFEGGRD